MFIEVLSGQFNSHGMILARCQFYDRLQKFRRSRGKLKSKRNGSNFFENIFTEKKYKWNEKSRNPEMSLIGLRTTGPCVLIEALSGELVDYW